MAGCGSSSVLLDRQNEGRNRKVDFAFEIVVSSNHEVVAPLRGAAIVRSSHEQTVAAVQAAYGLRPAVPEAWPPSTTSSSTSPITRRRPRRQSRGLKNTRTTSGRSNPDRAVTDQRDADQRQGSAASARMARTPCSSGTSEHGATASTTRLSPGSGEPSPSRMPAPACCAANRPDRPPDPGTRFLSKRQSKRAPLT